MVVSERRPLAVFVTTPDGETARRVARTLVEEGLAACGQALPGLTSIYRWEGRIHEEAEVLLLLKTFEDRFEELCARVVTLHPYEVPQVTAVPLAAVHGPYLAWMDEGVPAP